MKQQTCFKSSKLPVLTFLLLLIIGTSCAQADREESEFKILYEVPRFPGCEEHTDWDAIQLKACADQKMLEYVYGMLEYPEEAEINEIEGTVVVNFVIDPIGEIYDIEVSQSVGYGCDEEAVRIVESFPAWIPGKDENGDPTDAKFGLPIRFKLP